MPLPSNLAPEQEPVRVRAAPAPSLDPARNPTHDNVYLLQRTQTLIDGQAADPQYWTAYDRFMLEREARAIRRAYLGSLIAGVWNRVRERFAAQRIGAGATPR